MLNYRDSVKIWLAVEPIDFRKGARSLLALCRFHYEQRVEEAIWFVFTNRRRVAIKVLSIDSTGCWLATKYFDKGKLAFWPSLSCELTLLTAEQLELIVNQQHPIRSHYVTSLQTLSDHLNS